MTSTSCDLTDREGWGASDRGGGTRILVVADRADVKQAISVLDEAGIQFTATVVETEDAFMRGLKHVVSGVVLAHAEFPAFSCWDALEYTRRAHPEIPVIVLSDQHGAEAAVEFLKAGARDYVATDNLSRLTSAVPEALHWEEERRRRGQADRDLRVSEMRYRR